MSAAAAVGADIAFQVWSGFQQASAIRDQARLDRRISELNARYAEIDAWEAEKAGYTQSSRYQSVIDATLGEQRVAFAEQNVDVTSGTALQVQTESKLNGFLNILDIQNSARAKAMGLKREASGFRLGSSFNQSQAEVNASSAQISGIARGISAAASGYARS